MEDDEIQQEIRRIREEHARECNYDVHRIFEDIRAGTERLRAKGWKIYEGPPAEAAAAATVREDPPTA